MTQMQHRFQPYTCPESDPAPPKCNPILQNTQEGHRNAAGDLQGQILATEWAGMHLACPQFNQYTQQTVCSIIGCIGVRYTGGAKFWTGDILYRKILDEKNFGRGLKNGGFILDAPLKMGGKIFGRWIWITMCTKYM